MIDFFKALPGDTGWTAVNRKSPRILCGHLHDGPEGKFDAMECGQKLGFTHVEVVVRALARFYPICEEATHRIPSVIIRPTKPKAKKTRTKKNDD